MKRAWLTALLAGVALLMSGMAFASSHSAPAEMTFLGMVLWEVEHFMIHMNLTASAIFAGFTSPAFAWAMLGSQTLCATLSPIVGILFATAWSALLTFALVILAITAFVIWIAYMLRRSMMRRSQQFNAAYA